MSKRRKELEAALKLWGPIQNNIDRDTLELWGNIDQDSSLDSSLEICIEKAANEEPVGTESAKDE
jgi:hypothetical protein